MVMIVPGPCGTWTQGRARSRRRRKKRRKEKKNKGRLGSEGGEEEVCIE